MAHNGTDRITNPAGNVLVIVDFQVDYMQNGELMGYNTNMMVPVINNLRKSGKFENIVKVRDWHPYDHISFIENFKSGQKKPEPYLRHGGKTLIWDNGEKKQELWVRHCVQNSKGAQFEPSLTIDSRDFVINKGTNKSFENYSGFSNPGEDTGFERL